jgi:hypothetical protein
LECFFFRQAAAILQRQINSLSKTTTAVVAMVVPAAPQA